MKKVKWIALALVLCLGLIGGAYAYWQETLTVDGTVDTANFDVKFQELGDLVFHHEGEEITGDALGGADVSSIGLEDDDRTLAFTVTGGWPHLVVGIPVEIRNDSGIPVKLEAVRVKEGDSVVHEGNALATIHDDAMMVVLTAKDGIANSIPLGIEGSSDGEFPLGYVLDAKSTLSDVYLTVQMNDGVDVDPDASYEFKIEMDWVQWNKPADE